MFIGTKLFLENNVELSIKFVENRIMKATIALNEIAVQHSIRPDIGREFLTIDIENGWDDVKKLTNKVLNFDNKKFTFTGWCSDTNKCFFAKPLDINATSARITNK